MSSNDCVYTTLVLMLSTLNVLCWYGQQTTSGHHLIFYYGRFDAMTT